MSAGTASGLPPSLLARARALGDALGETDAGQSRALRDLLPRGPVHNLRLDQIEVRERSRVRVGGIDQLADSIRERGLLHPPVVRRDGDAWVLVAGQRRIEALRLLGRTSTVVTVAHNLLDELSALQAEGEENTERADFTPEEAVRHRRRIEAIVAAEAKERQGNRTDLPEHSTKLEEGKRHLGESRHQTAKGTGYSATTLDKAEKVVEAAEDESLPEPVREVAQQARAEMNETGKVDGPARKVREAKDREVIRQATEAVGEEAEAARQQLRANFARLHHQFATGLLALSPEHVAAVVTDDVQWRLIESTRQRAIDWFDAVLAARPKPFTVIDGGRD